MTARVHANYTYEGLRALRLATRIADAMPGFNVRTLHVNSAEPIIRVVLPGGPTDIDVDVEPLGATVTRWGNWSASDSEVTVVGDDEAVLAQVISMVKPSSVTPPTGPGT